VEGPPEGVEEEEEEEEPLPESLVDNMAGGNTVTFTVTRVA
jgi:hypothetical protein